MKDVMLNLVKFLLEIIKKIVFLHSVSSRDRIYGQMP